MRFFNLKLLIALSLYFTVKAQALEVIVKDRDGNLLNNAVVWLEGESFNPKAELITNMFSMGQKDRTFTPHILVVPQGAKVEFPNFDSILHHVYSFSQPKPFELKLYRDTPKSEIKFENSGVVELGCNIHDWMLGYILVVNSNSYALTNNGIANITLNAAQFGAAKLNIWHERFEKLESSEQLSVVINSAQQQITYQIRQSLIESFTFEADEMDGYE